MLDPLRGRLERGETAADRAKGLLVINLLCRPFGRPTATIPGEPPFPPVSTRRALQSASVRSNDDAISPTDRGKRSAQKPGYERLERQHPAGPGFTCLLVPFNASVRIWARRLRCALRAADGAPLGQERCEARLVVEIMWRDSPAGRIGDVHEDGGFIGFVRLANDWFDPDDLQQHVAWVVEWMVPGIEVMQRGLVELGGLPASTFDREHDLGAKAQAVLAAGPPEAPEAFGFGPTGFETHDELRELVQLASFALQGAEARLFDAVRRSDQHAVAYINIAAVELAGWVRALDYLMTSIWRDRISNQDRERISQAVDAALARPGVASGIIGDAQSRRTQTGEPYDDWTIALLSRGVFLPRRDLMAWRWLAGKLLHHGPLSAVERLPWRRGAEPRWKWRSADAIFPPALHEQRVTQRAAYNDSLAGRDVMGSTNFFHPLREMEFLFNPLLR
jgi:hypothetical protein